MDGAWGGCPLETCEGVNSLINLERLNASLGILPVLLSMLLSPRMGLFKVYHFQNM